MPIGFVNEFVYNKIMIKLILASLILFGTLNAHAVTFSPLGVSLFHPFQFPGDDFTITGARINLIYGATHSVYGLDVGVVNETRQTMGGIQVGAVNLNQGQTDAIGFQAAGLANINSNKANIYGVQCAAVNYNKAESFILGIGAAVVNYTPFTKIVGAQVGAYNTAGTVYGFQIGVINTAQDLHGIQIGLLNFNVKGLFSVAPILNVGF